MVVYLVGAGPGDPELITIKAKRLIKNAEILIYDRLVNDKIIRWAPIDCKIIYVGKRDSNSETSHHIQEKINALLLKYGSKKQVVRLKGGDPFIFGRGGEEALICENAGIKFEIVPGISSFYAAPAYAGIPVSHRNFNSVFAVLTGHESKKAKTAINWSKLPETLIILMGVSKIQEIAKNLLSVGRDPKTPVAAIRWGTSLKQRTIITNLGGLSNGLEGLNPPTVFVIGNIVSLHSKLNWLQNKLNVLKGKKIILARAYNHMDESKEILESYGINPVPMPLIEIVPRNFNIPNLDGFDALVFTSVEGIRRVVSKIDLTSFKGHIFTIGPKSKEYLLKNFGINSYTGNRYNSEGLAEEILKNLEKNSKILALRSSAASKTLKEKLSSKFYVTETYVYDIKQLPADPNLIEETDAIFVMSASCAKSLSDLDDENFKNITVVSIGPETSRYLTMPHITANEYTFEGMLNEYLNYIWRNS